MAISMRKAQVRSHSSRDSNKYISQLFSLLELISKERVSSVQIGEKLSMSGRNAIRLISVLRNDFLLEIVFVKQGQNGGYYVINDWGLINPTKFRSWEAAWENKGSNL